MSEERISRNKTPEYISWINMKDRCLNPKNKRFARYAGRGITVCERWVSSFDAFLEDVGFRPTIQHSIERIDNNGNYSPDNVKWATPKEQSRNRSTNVFIEIDGQRKTIAEWAELSGINQLTLARRVRDKWPIHRLLQSHGWKITQEQTIEIAKRRNDGESRNALAAEFGISPGHVRTIARLELARCR